MRLALCYLPIMKYCQTCQHCYEDAEAFCRADGTTLIEARPGASLIAGKYQLETLLGRGDQGTAYEATEIEGGRSVIAVELLRGDVLSDPAALERFHLAAQAAGRNNGQEVGEIRDSGALPGGGAYVVMELIDEEAEGSEGASTAPEQTDTPTVVMQAPMTVPLRPPGRNTGKLSKVAVELTQEVPRLPIPLRSITPARPPAAGAPTAPRDTPADVTREMSALRQTQVISTHRVTTEANPAPSVPIVIDVPQETVPRRRPRTFYLGLAFAGLACALLFVIFASRLKRAPAATPPASAVAGQSTATQPSPAAVPQARQTMAPVTGRSMPDAVPENASPVAAAGDGMAARSSPQAANREADVRAMLDDWVAAAAAQDVDRLMAFYSPELDAFYNRRGVSSSSIRTELTRLYKRAGKVDVRVLGEPRITFEEGGRFATVRIRLGYTILDKEGKTRRGEAAQVLRLVKTGDDWKITDQRGENILR
jgi:ketosteroid isomerase-like protein